jgi:hypothetical protein
VTADEAAERFRFFPRITGSLWKLHDGGRRHSVRLKITFHHLGNPGIGPQIAAAYHNLGGEMGAIQLGCMRGAIPVVVIIAKHNNYIGLRCWVIHHPELACKTHQGMPNSIDEREKSKEHEEEKEPEENTAMFGPPHDFNSNLRSRPAASSGINAL